MPELPGRRARHVDVLGGVLCALGLAGPVWALIEQPAHGWGDRGRLGAAGRRRAPARPVRAARAPRPRTRCCRCTLFRSRAFSVANVDDARGLRRARRGDVLRLAVPAAGRGLQRARGRLVAAAALADADPPVLQRWGALVGAGRPAPADDGIGPLVAAARPAAVSCALDAARRLPRRRCCPPRLVFGLGPVDDRRAADDDRPGARRRRARRHRERRQQRDRARRQPARDRRRRGVVASAFTATLDARSAPASRSTRPRAGRSTRRAGAARCARSTRRRASAVAGRLSRRPRRDANVAAFHRGHAASARCSSPSAGCSRCALLPRACPRATPRRPEGLIRHPSGRCATA